MLLRLTPDLFSGRLNPSWTLDSDAAMGILRDISGNKAMISTGDGPPILGFRGLKVRIDDPDVAAKLGLPQQFRLGDGEAADVEASAEMTRRLFKSAPAEIENMLEETAPLMRPIRFPADKPTGDLMPESTGPNDAWPNNVQTVADNVCEVEIGGYSPAFWNSPPYVLKRNNCYAYGCNMRTNNFAQPGFYSGKRLEKTLDSVKACAQADGALLQGSCAPATERPRWLMALVATPDYATRWDYHWYRRQKDGYWAHKPGSTITTNRDASGKLITDPKTCDRGIYTQWGGYLYAPYTMNIWGPLTDDDEIF